MQVLSDLETSGESLSYSKVFLLKSISNLLTTSHMEDNDQLTIVFSDPNSPQWAFVGDLSQVLLKTCKSSNLVHIGAALDCFFEIWSEAVYDPILVELGILDLMEQGESTLRKMYTHERKCNTYSPQELDEIENALENVLPFVQYKR